MGSTESVPGYRIIEVNPNSPASDAGLRSYLDIIITANGVRLNSGPTFVNILNKSNSCKVFLKVFNILDETIRETCVVPNTEWGGSGCLGASIRYEEWKPDVGNVHVMKVFSNSPASRAGLIEEQDYILGTDEISIPTVDYLSKAIGKKESLDLYIYNTV